MSLSPDIERLLRELAPQVLGVLVRRGGDFDTSEDAVQEALLAAATQWPLDGVPANPRGWLTTVASRRRIEHWRSESARRRREQVVTAFAERQQGVPGSVVEQDDSLKLLLLCCHPSLTTPSRVALTLRAVGGLTTAEIARAFLVPEPTVAQRISRAKQRIRETGAEFQLPEPGDLSERVSAVLHVLYLIFNEGYTASSGSSLTRVELSSEAIRLTRQLYALVPDEGEVAGLLALMLLTDARRGARSAPDGAIVPLADQDRRLWDRSAIEEGTTLIDRALASFPIGPFQLQAAIAALHDEAATAGDTDWAQILALYDHLALLAPGPMVTLNRIVAVAMVRGPAAGLEKLDAAAGDPALASHHRVASIRAHLLEMTGDADAARAAFLEAARHTRSIPEQRYLVSRAERLAGG